jgi:hypothetical protein
MSGKVLCGYQGWHAAEGDGCGRGWYHWMGRNGFKPGSTNLKIVRAASKMIRGDLPLTKELPEALAGKK